LPEASVYSKGTKTVSEAMTQTFSSVPEEPLSLVFAPVSPLLELELLQAVRPIPRPAASRRARILFFMYDLSLLDVSVGAAGRTITQQAIAGFRYQLSPTAVDIIIENSQPVKRKEQICGEIRFHAAPWAEAPDIRMSGVSSLARRAVV
jgi:hypothetical protein